MADGGGRPLRPRLGLYWGVLVRWAWSDWSPPSWVLMVGSTPERTNWRPELGTKSTKPPKIRNKTVPTASRRAGKTSSPKGRPARPAHGYAVMARSGNLYFEQAGQSEAGSRRNATTALDKAHAIVCDARDVGSRSKAIPGFGPSGRSGARRDSIRNRPGKVRRRDQNFCPATIAEPDMAASLRLQSSLKPSLGREYWLRSLTKDRH